MIWMLLDILSNPAHYEVTFKGGEIHIRPKVSA